MKVLLVGEFSRLHNSLKEGLIELGHDVLLVGSKDAFKNYPLDINISPKTKEIPFVNFFIKGFKFLFKIDLSKIEVAYRFNRVLPELKGFDTVQLINENSIQTFSFLEIWFLKKLVKQNKKLFLLSCGIDYISVKHAQNKKNKYSILTPLHNNSKLTKAYAYALSYTSDSSFKRHQFLYKNIYGVIASDLDYHIPLKNHPKYLGLIPNPINLNKIKTTPLDNKNKINIFHGINSTSCYSKGSTLFENALLKIKMKYPEKVNITSSVDVPYCDYIRSYNHCHILLDQAYSYDQGYNALEAMAKGKVVFTGAEKEWLEYYNLKEDTVAINALPDALEIEKKLEWLILHPEKILEISKNARAFIEKEHDYLKSAQKYVNIWTSSL